MSEYINRGTAFDAVTDLAGKASTRSAYEAVWKSARALKKIPAADVAPVVHGRWENGNPICPVCGEDKFKDLCETIFKFKSKWNENPYQEAVAAFNRRTNVNETPISPTSKWCDNQSVDELGKVICLAHLAEARVPDCPYKSKEERASAKYPCSDYEEVRT